MSRTTVLSLVPGSTDPNDMEYITELRNSHGSAPVVWNAMAQRYLGASPFAYSEHLDELCKIASTDAAPSAHRAVLIMTFDLAYVRKEHFAQAARDIRTWLSDFRIPSTYANHWPALAALYESDPVYDAIALWQTSVTNNPFEPYDADEDHRLAPTWDEAYEVYDLLNARTSAPG